MKPCLRLASRSRSQLLATVLAFGFVPSALAQGPEALVRRIVLPGESNDVAVRLRSADRLVEVSPTPVGLMRASALAGCSPRPALDAIVLLAADLIPQQDWTAAVDEYQRLIYDDGDSLTPLAENDPRLPTVASLPVRRLCHLRLAAAPPSALLRYQQRVDVLAQKLFLEGKTNHDPRPLQRLANDLFCSRCGDQALELLGDLAFEKGYFAEAEQWWRLLALPATEVSQGAAETLLFPSPKVDLARVRARFIISRAFQNQRQEAERELAVFRTMHPDARGMLAGQEGKYADIAAEVIRQVPVVTGLDEWYTFAGRPARNNVSVSNPAPRLWAHGPAWRAVIGDRDDSASFASLRRSARDLCYHPVIAEGRVLVAGARWVAGYDLRSGAISFRYALPKAEKLGQLPAAALPRFTVTATGNHIYARLGAQAIGADKETTAKETAAAGSYLVCLEMPPRDEGRPVDNRPPQKAREVWRVPAPADSQFEGAPLMEHGRVYIVSSQIETRRTKSTMICLDAGSGARLWAEELCDTPEFELQSAPRYRHHLLTRAGRHMVYCSHAGAVVAVDRISGKRAWGVRYAGRKTNGNDEPSPRELCPGLFHSGRLYLAPADADRIFCLDASTGKLVWESEPVEVVDLLGLARGKLLFTTAPGFPSRPAGLRALGAATGLAQDGWRQPATGMMTSFGRGALAGDWAFLPTDNPDAPVRVFAAADGRQVFYPADLRQIRRGNMAFGAGCLAVAGTDELAVYLAPELLLPKLQAEAAQPAATAPTLYRLGEAEAASGRWDRALDCFRRVVRSGAELKADLSLGPLALRQAHRILLQVARQGQLTAAESLAYLRQACGPRFPADLRVLAFLTLAEHYRRDDPWKALAQLQALLQEPSLGQVVVNSSDGRYRTAAALAGERIKDLRKLPAIDRAYEKRAGELLASVADLGTLEKTVHEFPGAQTSNSAWQRLASGYEKAGKAGAAAEIYRMLRRHKDVDQLPVLIGLARAYEHQQCWEATQAVWKIMAEGHGKRRWQGRVVSSWADEQMHKNPEPRHANPASPTLATATPLTEVWQAAAGDLLIPQRSNLAPAQSSAIFFHDSEKLTCLDAADGKPLWSTNLGFVPSWLGLHADLVIVASARAIRGCRLSDGQVVWSFAMPFVTLGPGGQDDCAELEKTFAGFQLAGDHLYFLLASHRLFAINMETGLVAWTRPSALEFKPHFCADGNTVLLQGVDDTRLGLSGRTGQVLFQTNSGRRWTAQPLPLAWDRVCVPEGKQLVCLHAVSGREIWRYHPAAPTSLAGKPLRLVSEKGILLAIVPRNWGEELQRLDPQTGRPLWKQPVVLDTDSSSRHAGPPTLDSEHVYLVRDGRLHAWALSTGKLVWREALKKTRPRRAKRALQALLVFSAGQDHAPWLWLPFGENLLAIPNPRLQHLRLRPLTLTLHNSADGEPIQQFDFPAASSPLQVQLLPDRIVVAAAGKAWGYR